MTSKAPPVPPESRSPKGRPKESATRPDKAEGKKSAQISDQEGQRENIKQNTPNEGHRQGR